RGGPRRPPPRRYGLDDDLITDLEGAGTRRRMEADDRPVISQSSPEHVGDASGMVGLAGGCVSACNFDPLVKWAPWSRRIERRELTRQPGFWRMKAHGEAPLLQR